MKILAVGAHPDDIEYGCGGTLLRYAEKGHSVYLLVMTKGTMGGRGEVRVKEQLASARLLKAKKIFWGGYQDTKIHLDKRLITKIEDIVKRISPDIIFCNYPKDTHQDHRTVSQAVNSVARYINNVLFYEVPTTQDFDPSVFVDIHDAIDKKMQLLKAHKSQICKTRIKDLNIVDIVLSNATFRGIQGRVKYAEGFMPLRLFVNI